MDRPPDWRTGRARAAASASGPAWWLRIALFATLALVPPACSDCNLSVNTNELPNGVVGEFYTTFLTSNCGGDAWFIQTGNLPPGIGVQDNGKVQGTPTAVGLYTFTVGVFDFGSGETAYRGLSILIEPAT
jgi:hypothetical protein